MRFCRAPRSLEPDQNGKEYRWSLLGRRSPSADMGRVINQLPAASLNGLLEEVFGLISSTWRSLKSTLRPSSPWRPSRETPFQITSLFTVIGVGGLVYKSSLALPNCVQVISCSTQLCTSHPLLYPTVYKSSLALPNCVQVIPCSTQLCTSHPLLYPTVYKSSLALPNCVQVIPCSTQLCTSHPLLYPTVYKSSLALPNIAL
ncbi:hypothetical protein RRG08_034683 [Elysia crispata]|uniref:Uncharacterized protein n=1 Tax=Elysia crispata TaxID=231223 RepID=A0AAE0Z1F7_9GAST|nr:hypothetical protein RRG08_034683 [Elysia crispata]